MNENLTVEMSAYLVFILGASFMTFGWMTYLEAMMMAVIGSLLITLSAIDKNRDRIDMIEEEL